MSVIILGIETATIEVGVGLSKDGAPLASLLARPGLRHVETLHPAINATVEAGGIALSDIDAIAVDVGPGLFTGLRVGIAAAKALAFGLSVPAIAVRSTEILLAQADLSTTRTLAVIDMRRGEVAWARAGDEVTLGTPEALHEQLVELDDDYLLVGDGARRYAGRIVGERSFQIHLAHERYDAPSAAVLAGIAYDRFVHGEIVDVRSLTPLYLRPADAKVNFATRASQGAVGGEVAKADSTAQ